MKLKHLTHAFALVTATAAASLCSFNAHADWSDWTGNVSGEQILDGVNQGSRIRFRMSNSQRPFSQAIYADYLRSDTGGNGFGIGYAPRFWFRDNAFTFAEGNISSSGRDEISYVTSVDAGLGLQFINTPTRALTGTVGVNHTANVFDDDFLPPGADSTTDTVTSYGSIEGEQQLTDFLKTSLAIGYSTSDLGSGTAATLGIKLRVSGGSVVINYTARSDTQANGNSAVSSNDTSVSFQYGF